MTTLVLTAHGSADPRSGQRRRGRPSADTYAAGLDVRVAFLERNSPGVPEVLTWTRDAVVTPLLVAEAYHARIDIPGQIARFGAARRGIDVRQADVLGEDDRLISVLRQRLRGEELTPTTRASGC